MRLLIDECVDVRLRLLFPGHDYDTARYVHMAGLKNGFLLDAAEEAGFDVLVTVDQNKTVFSHGRLYLIRPDVPPGHFPCRRPLPAPLLYFFSPPPMM